MTSIEYSVIGQGSHHEVYMLHGVKGGVIAIICRESNVIEDLIFAIKYDINNNNILPEFVDPDTEFVGHYTLHNRWGWLGKNKYNYPELSKYRAYYSNSYRGVPNQEALCIQSIENKFKTIKEVYDKNTSVR